MLRIINGTNIEYTKGDTFRLEVAAEYPFPEGERMRFVLAQTEKGSPEIDRTFDLSGDMFVITMDKETEASLELGDYIYKLIEISLSGSVVTQKSGDFRVKWGA